MGPAWLSMMRSGWVGLVIETPYDVTILRANATRKAVLARSNFVAGLMCFTLDTRCTRSLRCARPPSFHVVVYCLLSRFFISLSPDWPPCSDCTRARLLPEKTEQEWCQRYFLTVMTRRCEAPHRTGRLDGWGPSRLCQSGVGMRRTLDEFSLCFDLGWGA